MRERKSGLDAYDTGTAVRLTNKRRQAKVGDIFRLSPHPGIFLWGRVIKKARFFGLQFDLNLVYIYDAFSSERPRPELLTPTEDGPVIDAPSQDPKPLSQAGIGNFNLVNAPIEPILVARGVISS